MTMQQMNEYLEKRGFEVERVYNKALGIYSFRIRKNGNFMAANFKYPETNDWNYKNERMQEFLDKFVADFEERYPRELWPKKNSHVYISTGGTGYTPYDDLMKSWKEYVENDMRTTKGIYQQYVDPMEIKDVIFNDPATIVFWADGTKTVVKCQEGDEFDPEKGLAMAIAKKVYGNKGSYCNVIKKWCEPYYERRVNIQPWLDAIKDAIDRFSKVCDA